MSDLSDRLKQLAGRGTPRGAAAVFGAAQADAAQPAAAENAAVPATVTPFYRRATVATAIAASVALIGGIAAALTIDPSDPVTPRKNVALATTTTTGEPSATPTTLSEETRVYLASTRLIPFDQCGTLSNYAKTEALKVVGPYGLPGGGGMVVSGGLTADGAATSAARSSGEGAASSPPPQQAAAPATGGPDYSDTNVQEAGIDEPDSVKTDGKTVFAVSQGKVFATAAGASPELIGSLTVDGAQELLRIGERLIVISPGFGVYAADMRARGAGGRAAMSMPYGGGAQQSRFTVVDISNPRAMKVTGHLDVDGGYVSARTVDGVARLVVRSQPNLEFAYPQDGTPEAQAAAKQRNVDAVKAATIDTWLPHYTATNGRGEVQPNRPLVACGASYRPPAFSGFGMLSVLSFNADNPSLTRAASVMAGGDIVYASPTRVYVATNSWGDVRADGQVVEPSASTLIHAFDISDPTQAVYRESGRVRGTVLNQFAMSEYKGALRVATTDPKGGSESFMTVLGDSGQALVQIGQVGGLGKGERIYAVRFIDATAYVVTFRQVDPLYVIDLREPTAPKVLGELKITGYSAYLHPIGDGLLLGVGQEATTEGQRVGLQASIFDVRNPAAPKVVARYLLAPPNGGSSSTAEFDHHAFLYWPKTKLAVLPVQLYQPDKTQPFNGAVGLRVGDSAIDEVGRAEPPKPSGQDGQYYYGPGVDRSVVIGDRLYLTTQLGVLVTRLDNLAQTAWVAYPAPPQPQPGPEPRPAE